MMAQVGGKTRLTGLIGWPVSHSLSPAMHNSAAAALGLDLIYLPLEVQPDQLPAAVRGLVALGFRGANVTVPHKETVMPLLDAIDPAAAAIGAVNTIVVSGQWEVDSDQQSAFDLQPSSFIVHPLAPGPQTPDSLSEAPVLIGYNTDSSGFLSDLSALGLEVDSRPSLILGAGGSARAVAYGLALAGSQVHLFARREAQAQQLAATLAAHCPPGSLAAHAWPELEAAGAAFPAALVVNTTPLGMTPRVDASPWPESAALPQGAFVYDLVYNPAETRLMRQARVAGLATSNGLGMLLHQGALAFKLWTGLDPDLNVMAKALKLKD